MVRTTYKLIKIKNHRENGTTGTVGINHIHATQPQWESQLWNGY